MNLGEHFRITGGALRNWVIAQMQDSLAVALLWLIGLYALRVPWAPLWALLAACLQVIPHLGPVLGLIGPVLAVVVGTFMPQNTLFWMIALMGLAYLAPDIWMQHRASVRREHIRLGLPDALDLMVVCVDAGLAIDQALHGADSIREDFLR